MLSARPDIVVLRLIPGKGYSEGFLEKDGDCLDKGLEKDKDKDYSDSAHINSMEQSSGHSMGIPRDNDDDGKTDADNTDNDDSASSSSSSSTATSSSSTTSSSSSSSSLPCDAYFYALSSLRPSAVQGTSNNTPSQY